MLKIVIVSEQGMIVKFPASDIPTMKRSCVGVRGKMLGQGDKVVAAFVVNEE